MTYDEQSIVQTEYGLYFSTGFLQGIFDRCDALDGSGFKEEASALASEFFVAAQGCNHLE